MRLLIVYTPFKDLNVGDVVLVRPHDTDLVLLDGKSKRWCYQGWRQWIFLNGESSMVVPLKKWSNLDEWHLYEDC
jgi:hypothetical protein